MQLKPLADWLTQGLPIEEVRDILRQGLKRLTDARDRDLLACCFAMLVHDHRLVGQHVEVPACLRHGPGYANALAGAVVKRGRGQVAAEAAAPELGLLQRLRRGALRVRGE
jgi:hypothetical protein